MVVTGTLATQQLTAFLTAVADHPGGQAAQQAAVECAARALESDIAILMVDGDVAAAVGLGPAHISAYALEEIAAGRRTTLDLADGPHAVTYATIGGRSNGVLVLARPGPAFTAEEVCLLRGMAHVLELSLQSLQVMESERRYAEENGRLLGYLDHGRRVFEELGAVQRAIGRRTPVARVFDLVTAAFGFRNLANYRGGLEEFYRTLKPGGELGILDFSEPGGWMGKLYAFYFRSVLPAVGSVISGTSGPYRYLPSSVQRFPAPAELMQMMRGVGFEQVSWTPYSFGIAGLYRGVKPTQA